MIELKANGTLLQYFCPHGHASIFSFYEASHYIYCDACEESYAKVEYTINEHKIKGVYMNPDLLELLKASPNFKESK